MESHAPPGLRDLVWLPDDDQQRIGAPPAPAAAISHPGAVELLALAVGFGLGDGGDSQGGDPGGDVDAGPRAAWRRLLFVEPGLCAWAVLRAQRRGQELTTASIAIRWLAARAASELSEWTGRPCKSFPSKSAGLVSDEISPPSEGAFIAASAAWAHAAANAGVARLAAEVRDGDRPRPAGPEDVPWLSYLRAVFQAAPLGGSGDARPVSAPAWLAALLAAVPAIDPLGTTGESEAIVLAATQRWLSPAVDGSWVPAAMRKLARLARLESRFQTTLEAEKLAAMKELAYGAGHEINNPLANISARAQTLLREERDPERRRRLAAINAQAFRAHEMIADLMLFARPPQPKRTRVDLGGLVEKVVASLAPDAAERQTDIRFQPPDLPLIGHVDPIQMAVAVRALCVNALESLGEGGWVIVAVCRAEEDRVEQDGAAVEIKVVDNGPGISAEAAPRLYDPFFSGREAGRGLGLGLSKCWRIVTEHGGRIEAANNPQGGASFTIRLPQACIADDEAASPPPTSGAAKGDGAKVG